MLDFFYIRNVLSLTWIYCSTQNPYPSWFMFPKYSSVPQPSSKRKYFLQILRTCEWSFERKNTRRSSSLVKMSDLEFHFSKLGTLRVKNSCGFHFSTSTSGGNKSSDVLKEPLTSFVLKNVVWKGNLYWKVEDYLKIVTNIKNFILRVLRKKNMKNINTYEY